MEKVARKRLPNYTFEEKENLLTLVAKYKGIIECKRTGAYYIQKKKEAWTAITREYNSVCTSGPRDEAMLKHFYNNIKHRARKVSASENKQRYLTEQVESVNYEETASTSQCNQNKEECLAELMVESSNITIIDDSVPIIDDNINIQDLKKKWIDEKKNIKKTGGGSFNPTLTDADHQVLAILDDQIRPDSNPYDEAAEYFGETIEEVIVDKPDPVQQKIKKSPPKVRKLVRKRQNQEYPINKSAEILKKVYFKKKIELVYYQKKNEMQNFRYEKKKYELELKKQELEIKLLKMQLEKVEKE